MPPRENAALPGVREQMLHEGLAMAKYALASGMRVPPQAAATLELARGAPDTVDVAALARVHEQLGKLVAPATPRALLLMGDEHTRKRALPMLGPVGLVRRMMVAAVVSMVVFISVSLTKAVNNDVSVQTASGLPLLAVEMFWLSAAAMGASFAMLMQVSGYVVKRNYDPKYEASYWIKFFLGVMAGFILVSLVPVDELKGSTVNIVKPTLAMLGGFSASAVYRILTRLVESVESIFRGDAREEITRRENDARARAGEETSQVRVGLAAQIVRLQQEVSSGAGADAISSRLQEIVSGLVPDPDAGSPPASAPAPEPDAPEGTIALPNVPVVSAPPATPPVTVASAAAVAAQEP